MSLTTPGENADVIEIMGLQAYGYHGVFDYERAHGQLFLADISLLVSPARDDDLATTADYGAVAEQAHAILAGEPCQLIETVAQRIADACLAFPTVRAVEVTIHKPSAPVTVPFRDIALRIVRRSDS